MNNNPHSCVVWKMLLLTGWQGCMQSKVWYLQACCDHGPRMGEIMVHHACGPTVMASHVMRYYMLLCLLSMCSLSWDNYTQFEVLAPS